MANIEKHKCKYDGKEGISLRDESWEYAQGVIVAAFEAGYTYSLIDDSFMLFKEQVEDGETDCVSHLVPEDALERAKEEWWE